MANFVREHAAAVGQPVPVVFFQVLSDLRESNFENFDPQAFEPEEWREIAEYLRQQAHMVKDPAFGNKLLRLANVAALASGKH